MKQTTTHTGIMYTGNNGDFCFEGIVADVAAFWSSSSSSLLSIQMYIKIFLWAGHSSKYVLINSIELNENSLVLANIILIVNWL